MGPTESFGTAQLLQFLGPVAVGVVLTLVGLAFWFSIGFALSAKR